MPAIERQLYGTSTLEIFLLAAATSAHPLPIKSQSFSQIACPKVNEIHSHLHADIRTFGPSIMATPMEIFSFESSHN
jgi:hypothetical protein